MSRLLPACFLSLMTIAVCAGPPAQAAFPPGFLWGTAISGFQTEMGGSPASNDPNSDWWVWTHDPANIAAGITSGDLPEDGPAFYDRFASDIKLANRRLHSNALRLGIEWSRIFPTSTAGVDASGGITFAVLQQLDLLADQSAVAHYRAVLEELRDRQMVPFVTLSHFSLPLWIHDPIAAHAAFATVGANDPVPTGFGPAGWLDPVTATEFAKYAAYAGWKFGELVDFWAPLNEPMVVPVSGYANIPSLLASNFPPGVFSFTAILTVLTNEAVAQAGAYDALKLWDTGDADGDSESALVGLVHNMVFFRPQRRGQPVDVAATAHADYLYNRIWPNATILGDLDSNGNGTIDPGEHRPELAGKADFVGLNYYFRAQALGLGAPVTPVLPLFDFLPTTSYTLCPSRCSDLGWEIWPDGLRSVLATAGSYGLPVYITENGIADADDHQRPAFVVQHLEVLEQAIADGVADVRGYFHWSLMDNFEWVSGYQPMFGLYSLKPGTKNRKMRRSARFFATIARDGTVPQRYRDRFPY